MKNIIFVVILIIAHATPALSQQIQGVVICDVNYVLTESVAGQEAQAKMVLFEKILLERLTPLRDELISLENEYIELEASITEAEIEEKQAVYSEKSDEYKSRMELYYNEIQKYNASLYEEILKTLQDITRLVMIDMNANIVINKSAVFTYENIPDITVEVLTRYNQYYESIKK